MIMLLYLLVCGFAFRLYNLNAIVEIPLPTGRLNLEDLLVFSLLVFTLPGYLRRRKIIESPWFRRVEIAWLFLITILLIAALNSPVSNLTQRLALVRFVQPYLLFFPTIAVLCSEKRIALVVTVGVVFAILGTGLTIAQSLYGLKNLFDSPLYSIGAWPGNKHMVGGLARVNLPISNWIAFVLLVAVVVLLRRWRWWVAILAGFLAIAIYLNFARSLWLGIIVAIGTEILLANRIRFISFESSIRFLGIMILLVLAMFLSPLIGFENLTGALIDRLNEGVQIFQSSTGNWGERLSQMNWVFDYLQKRDVMTNLFGVGTSYRPITGFFIDLGFPATLMSIGIVGLVALFWLFWTCLAGGFHTMKLGVENGSDLTVYAGFAVPAQVVLMLIYQQWLIPDVASILAFSSATAFALPTIFEQEDDLSQDIENIQVAE